MMSLNSARVPIRILVTGTRGKSSLVRLLHAGLSACGLRTWARVTGVLPRELSPGGARVIRRVAPASFLEMRWWLGQIPEVADAIVMENSAVSPDLQGAAARWLSPTLLVWTTLRSDHEDAWGPGVEAAAQALLRGVPEGTPVAAGPEAVRVRGALEARRCPLTLAPAAESFREGNLQLALAALGMALGAEPPAPAEEAMRALAPDIADFRVLGEGEDLLAAAFSANDVESTGRLFQETGWDPEETTLLYHHRLDRPMRLRVFLPWIRSQPWRGVAFTRTKRSLFRVAGLSRLNWRDDVRDAASFAAWRRGRGRIFACGNVAGWPLEYLMGAPAIQRRSVL